VLAADLAQLGVEATPGRRRKILVVRRREVIARLGMTGAGAVVGAGLARLWDEELVLPATPASFASTVAPACARGRSELYWSGPSPARTVALTFDDGPTERFTMHVLDALQRFGVVATFFVIGEAAQRYPDLVRRVRDAGHEIQNHSQDHISAALLDRAGVRAAMERGADTVERLAGQRSRWYRPPRGEVTSATLLAARQTGHTVALWSLARDDHGELADGDTAGIGRHLRTRVHPGDVVDLHDGIGRSSFTGMVDDRLVRRRRAELTVLPNVIEAWLEQGYAFARLSDLIPPATAAHSAAASPAG
jgi:peptidoglycan/xylan/chitin deacetylase (PgdA/CDA1 family)